MLLAASGSTSAGSFYGWMLFGFGVLSSVTGALVLAGYWLLPRGRPAAAVAKLITTGISRVRARRLLVVGAMLLVVGGLWIWLS